MSADKFFRELIRQLQSAGFEVCVVSSPGQGLTNLSNDMGVRIHELRMARDISPLIDVRALAQWVRVCLRERPQFVITATPKASLLGLVAAKVTRVPRRLYFAVGLRLEGTQGNRRRILTTVERVATGASTEVVANSPSLAALYLDLRLAPAAKVRQTIPASSHGVDCDYFQPSSPDVDLARYLGLDLSLPVVGFVGRLTHDKGIDTLLTAMRQLADVGTEVQLLVVGPQDEPDSHRYLERLEAAGCPVVVVGAVDDVRPYFALMDVHVLPTLREGFPNVVLEASAMGIPTVTTDATGSVDSVRPGRTGLIVKREQPAELAAALKSLLDDPSTTVRLGEQARLWVAEAFRPDAVVRSLLESRPLTSSVRGEA